MLMYESLLKADLKHYSAEGSTWQITKALAGVNSLQFDCCSPPYQDVVFTITLQRLSAFDAKVAIAPAIGTWTKLDCTRLDLVTYK